MKESKKTDKYDRRLIYPSSAVYNVFGKKKILNLTKNEMCDISTEEIINYVPPRKYELFTVSQDRKYTLVNKPTYWKDSDEYKVIDLTISNK